MFNLYHSPPTNLWKSNQANPLSKNIADFSTILRSVAFTLMLNKMLLG